MMARSPIVLARERARTPTLIGLGAEDARVPNNQGKEFYEALRARGCPARLLVYPGNSHPIDKVDAECDFFVQMARWFERWLHQTPTKNVSKDDDDKAMESSVGDA